jgi:glycosyltransferase involved in cell wall biosynthesis
MKPRILLFGTYDQGLGYPRKEALVLALERLGFGVEEIRVEVLPPSGERKKALQDPVALMRWGGRILGGRRALDRGLKNALRKGPVAAVLVGHPGHFAIPLVRKRFDGPILLDFFFSLQDTIVGDRKLFRSDGWVDRVLTRLDRKACEAADLILVDTPENREFTSCLTGVPKERISFVPISLPKAPKVAVPLPEIRENSIDLLYLGTGVPLHGTETLLSAISRCEHARLTFVGGSEETRLQAMALGPHRLLSVHSWLDPDGIQKAMERVQVVSGIFGTSEKAGRVIPYKLIHGFAAGRVVLTGDTSAVNTLCEPGGDCMTVPVGDPSSLARALDNLWETPQILQRIGDAARRRYERTFSIEGIAERLRYALERFPSLESAMEEGDGMVSGETKALEGEISSSSDRTEALSRP